MESRFGVDSKALTGISGASLASLVLAELGRGQSWPSSAASSANPALIYALSHRNSRLSTGFGLALNLLLLIFLPSCKGRKLLSYKICILEWLCYSN